MWLFLQNSSSPFFGLSIFLSFFLLSLTQTLSDSYFLLYFPSLSFSGLPLSAHITKMSKWKQWYLYIAKKSRCHFCSQLANTFSSDPGEPITCYSIWPCSFKGSRLSRHIPRWWGIYLPSALLWRRKVGQIGPPHKNSTELRLLHHLVLH